MEHLNLAVISLYARNVFDQKVFIQITKIMLDLPGLKFIVGADYNSVVECLIDRSSCTEGTDQGFGRSSFMD